MRSVSTGEADVTLELFTKEWGKITAHSRGLRREASRLRYILQPMSWVTASIVRGAGGWRLTTANPDDVSLVLREGRASLVRVTKIVQRFFPHEVMSAPVFDWLHAHTERLVVDPARALDWEAMTLARLFQHLGYWGIETSEEHFNAIERGETTLSKEAREILIREINRILRTVHT
jgi:recombinational DNA repair protein (RecF pathway)